MWFIRRKSHQKARKREYYCISQQIPSIRGIFKHSFRSTGFCNETEGLLQDYM